MRCSLSLPRLSLSAGVASLLCDALNESNEMDEDMCDWIATTLDHVSPLKRR